MTDDDDIIAAEFALGLLSDEEGETVRRRAQGDVVLSLRIAWWRDQLAPLVAEAEATPPDRLWSRIEGRLPGNDNNLSLMQRWRAAAVSAMAVAAALVVFVGTRPAAPPVVPPVVPAASAPLMATLTDPKTASVVAVNYDGVSGALQIAPTVLDRGAGDVELWIIPEDGLPRSLGVIDARAPAAHSVPAESRRFVHAGATFAITQEVRGGSPTGKPGGPIVAAGKIIQV